MIDTSTKMQYLPNFVAMLVKRESNYTRTSPPGAVGAVGHPFGQSRLVDRNALRALLSASAPRMRGLFGASPPTSLLPPGCLPPGVPAKIGVRSLGRTTFSSRNRSGTNPKNISQNSPTRSHDDSAVRCMHYGGARTSNLPLNSYAKCICIPDKREILTPYAALNESAPTAR